MENNFFLPIKKEVYITLIDHSVIKGQFHGFVQFGGIPAIYLIEEIPAGKKETILLINQVIKFEVTKPKDIIL